MFNNGRAVEQGYDVFGHLHIPNTPFTLFGMFEWFQPNTKVNLNPFDFQRWIAGISYQYNEFLRFSINTQNLSYYHNNFAFSQAEAKTSRQSPLVPSLLRNTRHGAEFGLPRRPFVVPEHGVQLLNPNTARAASVARAVRPA